MNFLKIGDTTISLKRSFSSEEEAWNFLLDNPIGNIVNSGLEEGETDRGMFQKNCVAEIIDCKDISRRECDEKGKIRCFLMTLTDGKLIFKGMEYQPFEEIKDKPNPGSKILLMGPFEFRRKIALLCSHNVLTLSMTE
ncbi:unnamed protein product [Blepharisma stoltei]|uniref:RecQ mediated genome instability protein 1 OB-fold domain-containing protein n=1 Tax=Blepharisma stoltei TaxID=1481888 RepID=A0AAU9INR7_9CILI|nr:unnamed protein product [Blepharisma stoltei]